jgi:hypothetical protein
MPDIRLQLVGPPQLALGDARVLELERREAALLALLALEGPTPRSQAAALLWGDADAERQRSSLRQRLFQLRRRSGCEVVSAGDVLALANVVEHDLAGWKARLAGDAAAVRGTLLGTSTTPTARGSTIGFAPRATAGALRASTPWPRSHPGSKPKAISPRRSPMPNGSSPKTPRSSTRIGG